MRIVNPYKATSGDSAINADRDLLHSGFDEGASACDKEWVEWIEKYQIHSKGTESGGLRNAIVIPNGAWQERKKEIGL